MTAPAGIPPRATERRLTRPPAARRVGRTAVLVLNWRQPDVTADCVDSLLAGGVPPEDVLVVDNGSGDGSAERLAARFPHVPLLALAENTGYTGGNNAGFDRVLAQGRHEFVLVLNNDTIVPAGLVARLEMELDAHPRAGIAQPRIVALDGRTVDNAGFLMDRNGASWPRGRGVDPGASHDATSFFYASGACMLVRARVLRAAGGFDARYFMYNDDVDFSWRVRVAGWGIRLVDEARCLHAESLSAGVAPTKIGIIWRNRIATLLKNYGTLRLWTRVPFALLAMGLFAVATAINQRTWAFVPLYLKALAWNARHLGSTLRERRRVQATRGARDRDLQPFFSPSVEWGMTRARLGRLIRGGRPRA